MLIRCLWKRLREVLSETEIMPFPWKKGNSRKISKLVSDHLDSQRLRGGSLVVETGFPTSLVDLFVKNRRRLKKSSKLRKAKSDSSILESPLPLVSPSPELHSSPLPATLLNANPVVEETYEVGKEELKEDESFKRVLMAVLRLSVVVVLALGTKKFAVGLTMSAFFLFFLEYAGVYLYRLLMPCSEVKKRLSLMIPRVANFRRIREKKQEGKNRGLKESIREQEEISEISGCSVLQNDEMISPMCKLQVIQPKRFFVPFIDDIQCLEEEEIDEFGSDGKLIVQGSESKVVVLEKEEEYRCEVLEFKKKSRRAKIKGKMKHLFRRKSSSTKKEDQNLEGEINPIGGKNVMTCEEHEDANGNERELISSSDLSSFLIESYERKDELNPSVPVKEDMDGVVISKEEELQNKGNSGYLFLCLIVLIGLFGGRVLALMLILSWFFIKKPASKLGRCLTWPVIRLFAQKSS